MWKSVERYICEAAGISCDVVESRAPYDFERMVAERDLSDLNGIVVGGGDGTMHEVLQVSLSASQTFPHVHGPPKQGS